MANLIYDGALSFGKPAAIASGNLPDTLGLGADEKFPAHYPGKEFASAGRLTVDALFDKPAGGTGVTVTVQGSADGAAGWADVGKNAFTLDEMKAAPCCTAISPNNFKFLRVALAVTGNFTGSVQAFLNTYAGK